MALSSPSHHHLCIHPTKPSLLCTYLLPLSRSLLDSPVLDSFPFALRCFLWLILLTPPLSVSLSQSQSQSLSLSLCSNSSFSFKFPRLVTYSQKHYSEILGLYSPILPRPRFHSFDSPVYFWQLQRTLSSLGSFTGSFCSLLPMLLLLKWFKIPTTWSFLEDFLLAFVLEVQQPTHTINIEEAGGRDRSLACSLARWLAGGQPVQQSKSQERHTKRSPAR